MAPALPDWLPAAIAAPFVGSFLATLVLRLPERRSVLFGRSECPQCRRRLGRLEMAPLVSWMLLRGRCRHCKAAIGTIYPAIEGAALAIVLWAATVTSGMTLLLSCLLGWTLLPLAIIDWRSYELPDVLTAALLLFGVIAVFAVDSMDLSGHALGTVAGFGAFALIAVCYRRWRGRDGLGWGDAKLLGALGCWITWTGLPSVVLLAAGTALAWVLVQRLTGARTSFGGRVPFGPFLALAGWIVWLYGPLSVGLL